eukprot:SAG31_NODE_346_length_17349_cov_9.825875_5_plen_828_part_00
MAKVVIPSQLKAGVDPPESSSWPNTRATMASREADAMAEALSRSLQVPDSNDDDPPAVLESLEEPAAGGGEVAAVPGTVDMDADARLAAQLHAQQLEASRDKRNQTQVYDPAAEERRPQLLHRGGEIASGGQSRRSAGRRAPHQCGRGHRAVDLTISQNRWQGLGSFCELPTSGDAEKRQFDQVNKVQLWTGSVRQRRGETEPWILLENTAGLLDRADRHVQVLQGELSTCFVWKFDSLNARSIALRDRLYISNVQPQPTDVIAAANAAPRGLTLDEVLHDKPAWDEREHLNCVLTHSDQDVADALNTWLSRKLKANAFHTAEQLLDVVVDSRASWKKSKKTLRSLVNGSNLIWLRPKGNTGPWQLRAFAPMERERVMGLEMNWTQGSDTVRTKMVGNSWHVPTIEIWDRAILAEVQEAVGRTDLASKWNPLVVLSLFDGIGAGWMSLCNLLVEMKLDHWHIVYIAVESSNDVFDPEHPDRKVCGDGDKYGRACRQVLAANFRKGPTDNWTLVQKWTDVRTLADSALDWAHARQQQYGGAGKPFAGVNIVRGGWPCVEAAGKNYSTRLFLDGHQTGPLFHTAVGIIRAVREAAEHPRRPQRADASDGNEAVPDFVREKPGTLPLPLGNSAPPVGALILLDYSAEIRQHDQFLRSICCERRCHSCHEDATETNSELCLWCHRRLHNSCTSWTFAPERVCSGCHDDLKSTFGGRVQKLSRAQYKCEVLARHNASSFTVKWTGEREWTADVKVGRHRYLVIQDAQVKADPNCVADAAQSMAVFEGRGNSMASTQHGGELESGGPRKKHKGSARHRSNLCRSCSGTSTSLK